MITVFVALGANLGDPEQQANQAINAIAALNNTTIVQVSPFYRSKPLGSAHQPDYLNAVIKLTTALAPLDLLHELQRIEQQLGRVRKDERWGPRTLDLDILLYDDLVLTTAELTIPHYDMKNREFVLYPLFDLEPDLIFPDQSQLAQWIKSTPLNGMQKW